jgi:nucleotide-binding universal stress UspA family protein
MDGRYVIVVGVDGSEGGHRALHWAAREAAARGASLRAVTAWCWDPPGGGLSGGREDDSPDRPKQRAEDMLLREAATLQVRVPVAGQIVEGRTPDVLATAARDADLLVLGSHGHDRIWHAVLGSVAEEVVRKTACPVVVVPPPRPAQGPSALAVRTFGPGQRRLVPTIMGTTSHEGPLGGDEWGSSRGVRWRYAGGPLDMTGLQRGWSS